MAAGSNLRPPAETRDSHIENKETTMQQPKRVLVVSAHAADFCSRAGGTIAKYVNAGHVVRILSL